jgi:hypothetical protein
MARRPRPFVLAAFATAVAAVPLAASIAPCDDDRPVAIRDERPAEHDDPLVGLWAVPSPDGREDGVRFYYFHGNGQGLYRYGRVGFTNTNSFDYSVDGDVLRLVFRKTGARHEIPFTIREDSGGASLSLAHDPKNPRNATYVQRRNEPVAPHEACNAPLPAGRMWFDRVGFATGGYGFGMYQLRCAGIDGRGTGWFHRGDFDDWTTEALVYRIHEGRLDLQFATSHDDEWTSFTIGASPRTMRVANDPRDFWHSHDYVDVGPSFGSHDDVIYETVAGPLAQLSWAPPH